MMEAELFDHARDGPRIARAVSCAPEVTPAITRQSLRNARADWLG